MCISIIADACSPFFYYYFFFYYLSFVSFIYMVVYLVKLTHRKVFFQFFTKNFTVIKYKLSLFPIAICKFVFWLQVVSNRDTQETLICAAYVFEVSNSEHGAQHHIYRLVKDQEGPQHSRDASIRNTQCLQHYVMLTFNS